MFMIVAVCTAGQISVIVNLARNFQRFLCGMPDVFQHLCKLSGQRPALKPVDPWGMEQ